MPVIVGLLVTGAVGGVALRRASDESLVRTGSSLASSESLDNPATPASLTRLPDEELQHLKCVFSFDGLDQSLVKTDYYPSFLACPSLNEWVYGHDYAHAAADQVSLLQSTCGDDSLPPDIRLKQVCRDFRQQSLPRAGGEDASDYEVGDCFNDPDDAKAEDGYVDYAGVETLPCDQAHDNEVFLVFDRTSKGDDFPGSDTLEDEGKDECRGEFDAYVGISFDDSIYNFVPLIPSEESWDEGDREIVCIVYHGDLVPISKPVRGAAE